MSNLLYFSFDLLGFINEYFSSLHFNRCCWLRSLNRDLKKYKLTVDVKTTPNEKAVVCRSKSEAIPGRRERAFIELRRSKPVSNLGSEPISWETTGSSKDKHREPLRRHSPARFQKDLSASSADTARRNKKESLLWSTFPVDPFGIKSKIGDARTNRYYEAPFLWTHSELRTTS